VQSTETGSADTSRGSEDEEDEEGEEGEEGEEDDAPPARMPRSRRASASAAPSPAAPRSRRPSECAAAQRSSPAAPPPAEPRAGREQDAAALIEAHNRTLAAAQAAAAAHPPAPLLQPPTPSARPATAAPQCSLAPAAAEPPSPGPVWPCDSPCAASACSPAMMGHVALEVLPSRRGSEHSSSGGFAEEMAWPPRPAAALPAPALPCGLPEPTAHPHATWAYPAVPLPTQQPQQCVGAWTAAWAGPVTAAGCWQAAPLGCVGSGCAPVALGGWQAAPMDEDEGVPEVRPGGAAGRSLRPTRALPRRSARKLLRAGASLLARAVLTASGLLDVSRRTAEVSRQDKTWPARV
jgi:hypothetical protein